MSNVNKSTEIKIITRLLSKNAFDNYTLNKMTNLTLITYPTSYSAVSNTTISALEKPKI